MFNDALSRREYFAMLGAGASLAAMAPGDADRARRMKWWHQAKFGMFIHRGLYSLLGRHEWVMEMEGIPVPEYEQLTFANFTRKGNTLYILVHFWPGDTVAIGGLETKVLSARLLATGKKVDFQQERFRVRFTGLPPKPPDDPVTVLAVECESEPVQDMDVVRRQRPRERV